MFGLPSVQALSGSLPRPASSPYRWGTAWVLAAAALWLLATIGWRPLMLPDEGRYAGVAYEMLRTGSLVPTLNGLPFFHKPPLLYALDMAAMALLGVNTFAARLGPALMGLLMAAAAFFHLRRWHGEAVARTGLAVLVTCPFFFLGAQFVNHDIGVAACITLAVTTAVRALEPGQPRRRRRLWLVLAWLACGLGVLAKGLIGIVLPGLIVLPWLLAQRRWRDTLALLHPIGLLAGAMVVLPWMVAMQLRHDGFFDYFIIEQHFRRYASAAFNNQQPFWFYVAALPLLTLPWSLFLGPAIQQGWQRMRDGLDPRTGLYLWWIVVIVGFFSVPQSKLVGYVLPALLPWCALLAMAVRQRPRLARATLTLSALLCVSLVAGIAWKAPHSTRTEAQALAQRLAPGDRVAFVDHYFYDLPFYARLSQPVHVLSDWSDPTIPQRDNWRKELADATRFATPEQARVLWPLAQAEALRCGSGTLWLVTSGDLPAPLSGWRGLALVMRGPSADLWRASPLPEAACAMPDQPGNATR